MHAFTLALMLVAGLATASPLPQSAVQPSGQAFALQRRGGRARHGANIEAIMAKTNRELGKLGKSMDAFELNTGKPFPGQKTTKERKLLSDKKKVLTKRDPATAALELEDINDGTWWAGNVTVGTPPQTFEVDFDTGEWRALLKGVRELRNLLSGSADFWVIGKDCGYCVSYTFTFQYQL